MSLDTSSASPAINATPGLGDAERLGPDELLEAALDDLRRRWQRGERGGAAAYLERYPALCAGETAAALLYQEFVLRRESGDGVSLDDYLRQFPQYAVPLRHFRHADELLETALAPSVRPGRRVGDYELLEEIGRGGMGVVYKARQVSLGRVVALKMILGGGLASESDVRRLRNEAEAAAALQHPGIVAIHEVGEWAGQPFFSMDYVEGPTLAAVIREHPLPAPRAAHYVEAVAGAVQHAHEGGVLHRDLKPSNVIIGADDQPRVTDFGLARQVKADRRLTGTGQVLGTPSYMPPEQASDKRGPVGPVSDVYALGAVLYELLTGRPPFQAESAFETLLLVLGNEPVPPRRLNPGVPRDLETICLKCLQKDGGNRYATAAALADDLGRFRRGEPVRARPVGTAARAWRWCRRKPAVASLLAAVFLVFAGGLAVSLSQWWRADRERDTARSERERAEANLDMADEAIDHMLRHLGHSGLSEIPRATPVRRDLLLEARQLYQSLLQQKSQEPKMRVRLATIHAQLGRVQADLGQTEEALASLNEAIRVVRELVDEWPDQLDYWRQLAVYHSELGAVLARSRMPAQAEPAYGESQRILERLVNEHGAQPPDRFALSRCHTDQCGCLWRALRFEEAGIHARESLKLLGPLLADFPEDATYQTAAAAAHNSLAVALKWTKHPEEARKHYEAALELQRRLFADSPRDSNPKAALATALRNLAIYFRDEQQIDEARKYYREARPLLEELAAEFPDMHVHHAELAEVYHGLAKCAMLEEKWAEVRDDLQLALKQQRVTLLFDPRHQSYRERMTHRLIPLADAHVHLGEHQEAAEASYEARLFMNQPRMCEDAVQLLLACIDLAENDPRLSQSRRHELAERNAGWAVEVLRAGAKAKLMSAAALKEIKLNRLEGREDYHKLLAELEEMERQR